MKKSLFIWYVLFILFFITCHSQKISQQNVSYVFKKSYNIEEYKLLEKDFQEQLQLYDISIAVENWDSSEIKTDKGYIKQKFLTKESEKTRYVFIYSSVIEADTVYYEFKIRKEE